MGLEFLPDSTGTTKEDRTLQQRKQSEPQPLHKLLHHQQEQQCILRELLEDRLTKDVKIETLKEKLSSTGTITEDSDFQLRKQSEPQPLHKLLHNKQEQQFLLRELLVDTSTKDVTTAKVNQKFPSIIKEPLDQVRRTRSSTVICPNLGTLKKRFIHDCLYKVPKTITLVTTQLTRVSSQCLDNSKLCLTSMPCQSPCAENPVFQAMLSPSSKQMKCNYPIQSPKNKTCKRSSVPAEAAVKILKPSMLPLHRSRAQVLARKLFNKDSGSCADAVVTAFRSKNGELTSMESSPVYDVSSSQNLRKAQSFDPASGRNGVNKMKFSNKLGKSRREVKPKTNLNSSLQKLGSVAVKVKMSTNFEQEKDVLLSKVLGKLADYAEDISNNQATKRFGGKTSCSKRVQSRSTDKFRGFLRQASAIDGTFFSSPEICSVSKTKSLKKENPNDTNGITKQHRVNLRTVLAIREKKTATKVEDTHLQKSKIYPSDNSELVLPMRTASQSAGRSSLHDKMKSSSCTRLLCPLVNVSSQKTSEGCSVREENPSRSKSQHGEKTKISCSKWKCYSSKPKYSSLPLIKLRPGELHQQSKGSSSSLNALLPINKREHQSVRTGQIKQQILDMHKAKIHDDVEKLVVASTSSCDTSDFLAIHTNTLFSPETWDNKLDSKTSEADLIDFSYVGWKYNQDIIATSLLQTFIAQKVQTCPAGQSVCSKTFADKPNLPAADGEPCSRVLEPILDSQITTIGGFKEHYKPEGVQPLHPIETGEAFSAGKPESTLQNNANTFIMVETSESVTACKAAEEIGQPSPVSVLNLAFHDEIPSPDNSTSSFEPMNPLFENVRGSLHLTSTTLDASKCSTRWICSSGDNTKIRTFSYRNLADHVFDNSTLARNDKKEHVPELPALRSDYWRDANAQTQLVFNGDRYAGYEIPEFEAQQRINGLVSNSRILSEFLYENMLFGSVDQTLEFSQSCQKLQGPQLKFKKHKTNTKAPTNYGCKKSVSCKIDNFVRKDMSINFGGRWMNFRLEMVKIGLEIECALFGMLLLELLNDL
ncbi:hypothetical protein O6H91_05G007800 [Diphasiastrum complanatum]|nr:hypothetical protein O6H91_15G073900 [Diphasiastrum complanatum]KAJ7554757.1 hypothetical protein O6H91_05G007800 [Diphasiastrum complanatum]